MFEWGNELCCVSLTKYFWRWFHSNGFTPLYGFVRNEFPASPDSIILKGSTQGDRKAVHEVSRAIANTHKSTMQHEHLYSAHLHPFLILDFRFDSFYSVRWLYVERDGLSCECFDENLHNELNLRVPLFRQCFIYS